MTSLKNTDVEEIDALGRHGWQIGGGDQRLHEAVFPPIHLAGCNDDAFAIRACVDDCRYILDLELGAVGRVLQTLSKGIRERE